MSTTTAGRAPRRPTPPPALSDDRIVSGGVGPCEVALTQVAHLTKRLNELRDRVASLERHEDDGEKFVFLCGCTTRARQSHLAAPHVVKYGPHSACTELEHVGRNGVLGLIVGAYDRRCLWWAKAATARFHDPRCEDPNRRGEIVAPVGGDRS